MATRTLLNEAIAEATSIKEAALANAKAALEESFAPHIKELFSKKVQELENEEKNVKEMKEKDHKEEIEEQAEDISLESLLSKLDEIEETEELDEMSDPVMRKGMKGDDAAEKETEEMRLKEEEDSLEESEETIEEEDHYEEDDTKMEQEEEEEESEEMEAEIDLDDMSEEDLKDFIEDVMKDMVAAGELEPGPDFEAEEAEEAEEGEEEGEMEDSEEVEITMDSETDMMEESEEIEESEELAEERGGKKGDEHKDDMKKKGHHGKGPKRKETAEEEGEIDYMKEEEVEEGYGMKKHKKEMEEALAEIEALKKDLQEVNLLNAKLLYANKLFKDKNLSESQKVKVLESFDKANSTKEAKLVYETLIEGIKSRPTFKRRSMVSEIKGSASKPTQVVKENKNQIVESDGMVARFQKLAGII